MKKKELNELRSKSGEQLQKEAIACRDKIWKLRNDGYAGKLKNVREIRTTRKQLARILTFLNQNTNV